MSDPIIGSIVFEESKKQYWHNPATLTALELKELRKENEELREEIKELKRQIFLFGNTR